MPAVYGKLYYPLAQAACQGCILWPYLLPEYGSGSGEQPVYHNGQDEYACPSIVYTEAVL